MQFCVACKTLGMGEQVGLRERKRLATRRTIQMTVLDLIQHNGLERVTVEEISARANISPRTFFNYFPSKEAAAVGDAPELVASPIIDTFLTGGWGSGIIADLARVLGDAVQAADDDVAMIADRRRILRQYPHLFAMRMLSMHAFEDDLAALVARRLAHDNDQTTDARAHDPVGGAGIAPHRDRARLITLVAFAALRHAWGNWADSDGSVPLTHLMEASFTDVVGLLSETPDPLPTR